MYFESGIFTDALSSQVRHIDAQLDQLYLPTTASVPSSPGINFPSDTTQHVTEVNSVSVSAHVVQLQIAIKSLSTASSSRTLLQPAQLQAILEQVQLLKPSPADLTQEDVGQASSKEQELEWQLVSKATAQIHGLVLITLLEQTIPLSHEIWYWDDVLRSFSLLGLYSLQTLPKWLWRWTNDTIKNAQIDFQSSRTTNNAEAQTNPSAEYYWNRFWSLVKNSVRGHSLASMQLELMSPLTLCLTKVKSKQSHLKRLREMSASGLGVLMNEGLNFELNDDAFTASKSDMNSEKDEWKSVVSKSVALMETVLQNVTVLDLGPNDFEDTVFLSVDEDQESVQHQNTEEQLSSKSAWLASRLQRILSNSLPRQIAISKELVTEHGRPSRAIRYWIPTVLAFLSSSMILRVCFNHKTEILDWIENFGTTTLDFWYNWVVDPLKKVIGTIRHDENSEVALMSKGSLQGDKASLERMVIDFVKDSSSTDTTLSETEILNVTAKIREGDLTPVLKAYEKDLRSPFIGTVRGNLVRALLIQIQKTKVDVEVAIGGIDTLLKSQELVFG